MFHLEVRVETGVEMEALLASTDEELPVVDNMLMICEELPVVENMLMICA
jgi:hypothetical protein